MFDLRNQKIDFKELETELIGSNHPPLYYVFLHVTLALFQGDTISLRPALLINILFFICTMFVLYELLKTLFKHRISAAFGLALFGFSLTPLNSLVLLKGYELQIFFVLAQTLLLLKQSETSIRANHFQSTTFTSCQKTPSFYLTQWHLFIAHTSP